MGILLLRLAILQALIIRRRPAVVTIIPQAYSTFHLPCCKMKWTIHELLSSPESFIAEHFQCLLHKMSTSEMYIYKLLISSKFKNYCLKIIFTKSIF